MQEIKTNDIEAMNARIKALEEENVSLNERISDQNAELYRVKTAYSRERIEKVSALTRVQKFERESRDLTVNELMLRFHEIKPQTPILWITTPDISVVNQGTFANLNDRLKRLCPNLDLVILSAGDFDVEQLSDSDLAKKGLFRLPDTKEYTANKDKNWSRDVEDISPVVSRLISAAEEFQKTPHGIGGKDFAW
jgi:hypothetical protein